MARPLKGSIKQTKSGKWAASVPKERGKVGRLRTLVDTEDEAIAWVEAQIARLEGTEVPEVVATPDTGRGVGWFEQACLDFHERYYLIEQHGHPDRADAVLRFFVLHIVPFFAPRWISREDVHFDDCANFMQYLAGRRTIDGVVAVGNKDVPTRALFRSSIRARSSEHFIDLAIGDVGRQGA